MADTRYTPGQEKTIKTLDKPLFVAAGAGSGKTFTLTQRIVWALKEGSGADGKPYLSSLDQALIITFTNAASTEIKERVREALEKEGLHSAALQVDDAWISTIHGMCSRILKIHALDLGLDPEFQIIDDMTRNQLVTISIEEVLRELSQDERYIEFLSNYAEKKDTLKLRIESLMSYAQSSPVGMDAISFVGDSSDLEVLKTELESLCVALEALKDEIAATKPDLAEQLQSVQSELLSKLQQHLVLSPTDFNQEFWESLEKAVKAVRASKETKVVKDEATYQLKVCSSLFGLIQDVSEGHRLKDITEQVYSLFKQKKLAVGGLDNDDLLHLTAKVFEEHPEIAAVYTDKFKLVMVDEFQDTDQQQVQMIKSLSGKDAKYLTTVGDAQQSIYRFRGADVDVFFRRQAEVSEDLQPRLVDNFRSHNEILRFVAKVCGAEGMIANFMDLSAGREEPATPFIAHSPRVYFEVTKFVKSGSSKPGDDVSRKQLVAHQLADRINTLMQDENIQAKDVAILMSSVKEAQPYIEALRTFGIESVVSGASTFGEQPEVQLIGSLLQTLANMYDSYEGLFPVLSSEIFNLDASDLLLLGTNFGENGQKITNRDIAESLVNDAFNPPFEISMKLKNALEVLSDARSSLLNNRVSDVLKKVVLDAGWISRLQNKGNEGQSKIANIFAALEQIDSLQKELSVGIASVAKAFSEWCSTAKESPKVLHSSAQNAVTFMTIHASKGLEFPVVAVVGAVSGPKASAGGEPFLHVKKDNSYQIAFSSSSKKLKNLYDGCHEVPTSIDECKNLLEWRMFLEVQENEAEEQEQNRCLYVALTRAREAVILTSTIDLTKEGISPRYTRKITDALFEETPLSAGEHSFEYGGNLTGCMRVVEGSGKKDEQIQVKGLELVEPSDVNPREEKYSQVVETFGLYEKAELSVASETTYDQRKDFFSYSSAHQQMAENFNAKNNQKLEEQSQVVSQGHEADNPQIATEASVVLADTSIDDGVDPTSLGSAFHELAQIMVETQSKVDEQIIDRLCLKNSVPQRAVSRVKQALELWSNSEIRQEALTHDVVIAESPFTLQVDSEYGNYVEGAIDLLAYNRGSKDALVVDYKTGDKGLSAAQIYEHHQMQANFYAYVLMQRGFTTVECAFVCVEIEEAGQPHVARYAFDANHQPRL
ncbi:UvrD-helicase domain-containing protein [Lancefieldella parvula]|uniref:UvrD-helicase domain-containing protein n=1 Tax=Lancefieldella parvula TaxID=1382 RepID=UPI0028D49122|nr:UvrD-helicase domain-containing protein [Lancefieldella parvula]